jgi:hypothetical protein
VFCAAVWGWPEVVIIYFVMRFIVNEKLEMISIVRMRHVVTLMGG